MKLIIKKFPLYLYTVLIIIGSIFSALTINYVDEDDNILGGILINQGEIPYRDFFSHHMPAPYFISSSITLFTHDNLIAFKVVWGTVLGIWLLLLGIGLARIYSKKSSIVFVLLALIASPSLLSSGLLAETLVGYSVMSLFILIGIIIKFNKLNYKHIIAFSLLNSLIVLSSLGFIYVTLFFYAVLLFLFIRMKLNIKNIFGYIVILATPFILLISYLLLNNALKDFIFGNYTFNTKYYSLYQGELEGNLLSSTIRAIIRSVDSTTKIILNLLQGKDIILFIFLSSIIVGVILLAIKRKRIEAFMLFVLFILLNIREGGINEYFGSNFHGMTYYLLSLFAFSITVSLVQPYLKNHSNIFSKILVIVFLSYSIFIPTYIIRSSIKSVNPKISYDYLRSINNTSEYVRNINTLLDENEATWIGPFDTFRDIIKLKQPLASKYTFYLPWQDSCLECNEEIINEFKINNPKVVYWKEDVPILKGWANGVDFKIYKYIQENYFTIDNPTYKGYYFNKNMEEEIILKLNNLNL